MIQHHKRNPYHTQENNIFEAFNKILEKDLTKICSISWDNWDEQVPTTLWSYHTIIKWLHKYTPFQLFYGWEAIVPAEFIIPDLFIAQTTHISEDESIGKRLDELWELDEAKFLAYFHQTVEKER